MQQDMSALKLPLRNIVRPVRRADGKLYRQAADRLRAAILCGLLPVGTELPAEADLAAGFRVSLITLRHALRELEGEGLIRKHAAKPAVVAAASSRLPAPRQINSLSDVVAATKGARLRVMSYSRRISAEAASVFGLKAMQKIDCLRGLLLTEEGPLSEITIYFPPAIGARLTRADFDDVVVFRSLERRLGIRLAGATITVTAEQADTALARTLDCAEGAAVLVSRMLYRDDTGAPVELTIARHRADRYSLSYDFS